MDKEIVQLIEDINHAQGPVFFTLLGIDYIVEQVYVEDSVAGIVNVYADARKYPYRPNILMEQKQFARLVKIDPSIW